MNRDETDEIERIYRQYIQDYPQEILRNGGPIHFDALAFWSFPLIIVSGSNKGSSIFVVEEHDFDSDFRQRYDRYRQDGWAGRVGIDEVKAHSIGPNLAVLEGRGTRYRRDGSVIDGWDSCYIMRKASQRWRAFFVTDARPRPTADGWRQWIHASFGVSV